MTLDTSKSAGDTIEAAEWNEAATAANKVTDQTLVAADVSDFDTEVSNNTTVTSKHTSGDTLDMTNSDLQNIQVAEFDSEYDNGNSGTTATIDWSNGNNQKITLTGDVTLSFTNPSGAGRYQIKLIQDGTGNRTVTFPNGTLFPSGTAPTVTTAAGSEDIVTFWFDGTNYYGVASQDFQAI